VNLSERFFYEWKEYAEGGWPTLDEYAVALREVEARERYAESARERYADARGVSVSGAQQQWMNIARDEQLSSEQLQAYYAQRRQMAAALQQHGPTALGTYIGQWFARLLMNAAGQTRIVTSPAEDQQARAEGWFDPNAQTRG
jgi:hypothetical protein